MSTYSGTVSPGGALTPLDPLNMAPVRALLIQTSGASVTVSILEGNCHRTIARIPAKASPSSVALNSVALATVYVSTNPPRALSWTATGTDQ
jgi:hypothetical protein